MKEEKQRVPNQMSNKDLLYKSEIAKLNDKTLYFYLKKQLIKHKQNINK